MARRAEQEAVSVEAELEASREVIRHPDIYRTRRASVSAAPAARSRPQHLQGEPRGIGLPGERVNWMGVAVVAAAIASVLMVLMR